MAEPFLSEIRLMSFAAPPKGWAACNGQLLPINQNQPLFSLLGTTYGGNGQTTFALPDLRGRVPLHVGTGHTLGQSGGEQAHTLSLSEMPTHTHLANAAGDDVTVDAPAGNLLGSAANQYAAPPVNTSLVPTTLANVGGSQAHSNMQPFLALTYCIALIGIFPSRN
jgi:microcystin-dependent protein